LSIIFDARRNAEQTKRAREAVAAAPQPPNLKPDPSATKDLVPAKEQTTHETRPSPQVSGADVHTLPSKNPETPTAVLLGLKVERRATDWRLRWNRNATANATRGSLTITDGAVHKRLELDGNELQNGSIVYTPVTDDAALRLEVLTSESSDPISESVRLVAAATSPVPAQSGGALPTSPARIARSDGAWAAGPDSTENVIPQQAPIVRTLLRVPCAQRFTATPSGSGPRQQSGTIEPATLISRKEPAYPSNSTGTPISGRVEVHFRISPEGRVYDARSENGSPVLAQAAIEAVEAWCYEPARLNGAPIDSEASTNFDFEMS
jgi:TonB family protein